MDYSIPEDSRCVFRPFEISCCTRGYCGGKSEIHADINQDAITTVLAWMMTRIITKKPIVKVTTVIANEIFAWNEGGDIATQIEPIVKFQGRIGAPLNSDMSHEDAIEIINDLATHVGERFNQKVVNVSYHDKSWSLLKEDLEPDKD